MPSPPRRDPDPPPPSFWGFLKVVGLILVALFVAGVGLLIAVCGRGFR